VHLVGVLELRLHELYHGRSLLFLGGGFGLVILGRADLLGMATEDEGSIRNILAMDRQQLLYLILLELQLFLRML